MAILKLTDICKDYVQGKEPVRVLKNVNLTMERGDYLAIMGPSGSGKTTLMNIIGCPEGIKAVQEAHPDVEIFLAAVDEKLNEHAYIVPGLGDAGDRIFGTK